LATSLHKRVEAQKKKLIKHGVATSLHWATHLGWSGGIELALGSVLLLKVSGLILSGANLGGLI
jgi:hypothetical protein